VTNVRWFHNSLTMVSLAAVLVVMLVAVPAAQAQTFSVIHSFGGAMDGVGPWAGVTLRGGVLYGTTLGGGIYCYMGHHCGTVYQVTHSGSEWVEHPIFLFPSSGSDGIFPSARVVFGPDGHLYGTTSVAGNLGDGTVFDLIVPLSICKTVACFWTLNVLHTFTDYPDGAYPGYGDLVWDQQGNIYGTTTMGGEGLGAVYQLKPAGNGWTETIIYSFMGIPDGYYPYSGLVVDSNGNLFGTTYYGGVYGYGTVYKLTYVPQAGWKETTLYSFTGGSEGGYPYAGLTLDSSGNLYGATREGPQGSAVFELSPSGNTWTFKVLCNIPGSAGQDGPYASLSMDALGNLYGTTFTAGAYQLGNIFKLTNTENGWAYTSLHDFTGGADGAYPISNVTIDTDGTLYGTASAGGQGGVVWMIKP
jgi:hypothetical protein